MTGSVMYTLMFGWNQDLFTFKFGRDNKLLNTLKEDRFVQAVHS